MQVFCTNLHYGEEPPLSGTTGSGTVFFSGCNLRCVYCQNFSFSQSDNGEFLAPDELADRMLILQSRGAININWVTATPHIPMAIEALATARENGLTIPLVYNCSGYESLEVIRLLDGIVDIYLPDAKYADGKTAQQYSGARDYPEINRAILKEMYRQAGPLTCDDQDYAVRGMLVRHLVLPDGVEESCSILKFIAEELGRDVTVSLMRQYFPAHRAHEYPDIARGITWEEYHRVLEFFDTLEFESAFIQYWEEE
jgi:putative pyruvate formate lyase activating enzyme